MDEDRRGLKWAALVVLCLLALFSFGVYIYFSERSRIIPSPGIINLETFSKEKPPPKRLVTLNIGDSNIFVWVGEGSKWLFSSGPPCYIFDSSGRMTDWDWETGSGQNTSALAQAAMNAPAITVAEAQAIINNTYSTLNP